MQRYTRLWWTSILLSSVVTGGGSFVLLSLTTGLPIGTLIVISVILILVGDIVLALVMDSVSPTRIKLGPGERWHNAEMPAELGTVIGNFEDRRGKVSIRGETWRARQTADYGGRLEAGAVVRVIEREGLTLVVAATDR